MGSGFACSASAPERQIRSNLPGNNPPCPRYRLRGLTIAGIGVIGIGSALLARLRRSNFCRDHMGEEYSIAQTDASRTLGCFLVNRNQRALLGLVGAVPIRGCCMHNSRTVICMFGRHRGLLFQAGTETPR